MKKIRILGIAPYQGLVTLMNQCALQYPEIELTAISGNMEHGYAIAKRSYDQYDIIISCEYRKHDFPGSTDPSYRYWNRLL